MKRLKRRDGERARGVAGGRGVTSSGPSPIAVRRQHGLRSSVAVALVTVSTDSVRNVVDDSSEKRYLQSSYSSSRLWSTASEILIAVNET